MQNSTRYSCPDGVTSPWGEEGLVCDPTGYKDLAAEDVSIDVTKKLASGTLTATLAWSEYECGEEDCWLADEGAFPVDLSFTPTTGRITQKSTEVYKDPENGYSYRGTETSVTRGATVTGSVDGAAIEWAYGSFGTYSFSSTYRMR